MHDLKIVALSGMAAAAIAGFFYMLMLCIDIDGDVRVALAFVVFSICVPSLTQVIGKVYSNENS